MQSLLALLPLQVRWPEPVSLGRAVGLFASLVVPLCFVPAVFLDVSAYTASLLIFAVPCLVLARSLSVKGSLVHLERPLLATWAVLVPMGVALNLLFADDFFTYPNHESVSGLSVPALDFFSVDRAHPIPLEEFAFYGLGFLAMLLGYAWVDDALGGRGGRAGAGRLGWRDGVWAPVALALAGLASSDERLPSYWVYLVAVPLPVTLVLWPRVRARLNGWALAMTMAVVVPGSFVWEAVLAVPRGWWGYQADSMLGVRAFGLPVEAVTVWLLAPITTAVLFEALRRPRSPR